MLLEARGLCAVFSFFFVDGHCFLNHVSFHGTIVNLFLSNYLQHVMLLVLTRVAFWISKCFGIGRQSCVLLVPGGKRG
jgi:hypothetical protein